MASAYLDTSSQLVDIKQCSIHRTATSCFPCHCLSSGPKTVFFWAPVFKWGLVFAGLADMTRPADKLSTSQSAVLTATGLIWSRYSLVIIPKNWNLFAVNFFVGSAGASQLYRIWSYKQEQKETAKEAAES
ncbi:Mitochondrial pyruvate carrier 2 [Ilyodon furcidens]|uniref:Mitochondrial pyruvate carrier n=1 Tax=Ilyodon furcidens TaxID=33524 RepID=A0ABV0SS18_9TELE